MSLNQQPQANSGYKIYGLTVSSPVPLPGLPPADPNLAEVVVNYGPTADFMADAVPFAPDCQVSLTASRFWCRVQGVARYFVPDKQQIIITPDPGADPRFIRHYLLSPVFYALLFFRGFIPLHANAVEVNSGGACWRARSKPVNPLWRPSCASGDIASSPMISAPRSLMKTAGLWCCPAIPSSSCGWI